VPTSVGKPRERRVTDAAGYTELLLAGDGLGSKVTNPHINSTLVLSAVWSEAGWPVRSMGAAWFSIPDASVGQWTLQTQGAMRVDARWLTETFPDRSSMIPLSPIWPGF